MKAPLTIHFDIQDVAQRRAIKRAARQLGFRVELGARASCFAVRVASVDDFYRFGQMTATAMKCGDDPEHDR